MPKIHMKFTKPWMTRDVLPATQALLRDYKQKYRPIKTKYTPAEEDRKHNEMQMLRLESAGTTE